MSCILDLYFKTKKNSQMLIEIKKVTSACKHKYSVCEFLYITHIKTNSSLTEIKKPAVYTVRGVEHSQSLAGLTNLH